MQSGRPGDKKMAPARCAGAKSPDLVSRIPDQEEAALIAQTGSSAEVCIELAGAQLRCRK